MFKIRPNIEIDAVLDDDLEELLINLNIKDAIEVGEYQCHICEDAITLDNIGMIIPQKDEIQIICEKPSCMLEFAIGE